MILLEDTRQQIKKHEIKHKWFSENGVEIRRTKLYVGDYTLPATQNVCIDSKRSILEIISNICGEQHVRFREELKRAQEAGIELYILIENTEGIHDIHDVSAWQNPRTKIQKWITTPSGQRRKVLKYPDATKGETLFKAMRTMQDKYGVKFLFCHPDEAGEKTVELLGGSVDES